MGGDLLELVGGPGCCKKAGPGSHEEKASKRHSSSSCVQVPVLPQFLLWLPSMMNYDEQHGEA